MGNAIRLLASVATAVLFASVVVLVTVIGSVRSAAAAADQPNIVFVLTDDLDSHDMRYLDGLRSIMAKNGTTFQRAYVSDSVCCPSRATILRGQYPHNHGIKSNVAPTGGAEKFHDTMKDQSTVATWLNGAGYQTKFIGKYLNGYNQMYIPPGWDEWFGWLGEYDNKKVNDDGQVFEVQGHDTDVFANQAVDFIDRASANPDPFFLNVWTRAPHQPAIPAPRYADRFRDTALPHPPSFDEADVSDKPRFIRDLPRLSDSKIKNMRSLHQDRLASMLSVEDLLRDVIAELKATGELSNTYIFFASDNGFHLGQHRMTQGKRTAYEEDIRVPLMVRGPGVPAGRALKHEVLNNDLAPTFAQLAGVTPPSFADGKSMVPLLGTSPPTVSNWRTAILTENWRTDAVGGTSDAPTYKALRTKNFSWVRYVNGERELYDLRNDPYQLHSRSPSKNRSLVRGLNNRLDRLATCDGAECRAAETK